jgi:PAS domain S-box-containing protein
MKIPFFIRNIYIQILNLKLPIVIVIGLAIVFAVFTNAHLEEITHLKKIYKKDALMQVNALSSRLNSILSLITTSAYNQPANLQNIDSSKFAPVPEYNIQELIDLFCITNEKGIPHVTNLKTSLTNHNVNNIDRLIEKIMHEKKNGLKEMSFKKIKMSIFLISKNEMNSANSIMIVVLPQDNKAKSAQKDNSKWIALIFNLDRIVNNSLIDSSGHNLNIELSTVTKTPQVLYTYNNVKKGRRMSALKLGMIPKFRSVIEYVYLGDDSLKVNINAGDEYRYSNYSNSYWLIIPLGLIAVVFIILNLQLVAHLRSRVIELVKEKTNELERKKGELEDIVRERSSDLIKTNERLKIEIESKKETEKKLVDSLTFNQKIVSDSPIGIITCNAYGEYEIANEVARTLLQIKSIHDEKNYCAESVWKRYGLQSDAVRSLREQKEIKKEVALIDEDNGTLWLECSFSPFIYDGKEHVFVILYDITERIVSEQNSIQNEKRLLSLVRISQLRFDNLNILLDTALDEAKKLTNSQLGYIYLYDEVSKVFSINPTSEDVAESEKIKNPCIYDLVNSICLSNVVQQRKPFVKNTYNNESGLDERLPGIYAIPEKILAIPIVYNENAVAAIVLTDKTDDYNDNDARQLSLLMDSVWSMVEHQKIEQELRTSEERFVKLFTHIPYAMSLEKLSNNKYVVVNDEFCNCFGYLHEEIVGKTGFELQLWFNEVYHRKLLEDLVQLDSIKETAEKIALKDGSVRDIVLTIQKLIIAGEDCAVTLIRDVTDEKKAIEARMQLAAIVQTSGDAIISLNINGNIETWNTAAKNLFGYSQDYVFGRSVAILIAENDKEKFNGIIRNVFAGGKVTNCEINCIDNESYIFPAEISVSSMKTDDNVLYGISILVQDIEQKRNAENALKEKTEMLDRFFTIALDLLCIANTEGKFLMINHAWEKLLGYSYDEIMSKKFFEFVHPDDYQKTIVAIGELSGQKDLINFINRYRCKDGSYRWIEWRSVPYGTIIYAAARDITERVKAQNELCQSKQMLQTVLDNIPQRVFWKDKGLNYVGCNVQFATDAGMECPDDIVLKNDFDLPWKKDAESVRIDDIKVITSKVSELNIEAVQYRHDGASFWVRTSKIPLCNKDGTVYGLIGTYEDITDQKRMEQEQLFHDTLENISLLAVAIDLNAEITYCNQAFEKLTKTSKDMIVGQNWFDKFQVKNSEEYFAFRNRMENGEKSRQAANLESYIILNNSELRYIHWSNTLLHNNNGSVAGMISVGEDITERKKAEQYLRESEERFRAVFDQAAVGVTTEDLKGRFTRLNPTFCKIIGYNEYELIGKSFIDLIIDTEFRTNMPQNQLLHDSSISNLTKEMLCKCKDGEMVWINLSVSIMRDSSGDPLGFIGVVEDITPRKLYETVLHESVAKVEDANRRMAFQVNNMPVAYIVWDREFKVYEWNAAAERIFEWQSTDAIGEFVYNLIFSSDMREEIRTTWNEVIDNKRGWPGLMAHINITKNSRSIVGEWFSALLRDDNDTITGCLCMVNDITERVQAEDELRKLNEQLELRVAQRTKELHAATDFALAANKAKTEFLANMSHEIRTPLNAIIGMAEILQETVLSPHQQQYVRIFKNSGENLLSIINDVLDISKIEAGEFDLHTIQTNLLDIIQEVSYLVSFKANLKNLKFKIIIELSTPLKVRIDGNRIRQVLVNLLGNAVKFTDTGFVELKIYSDFQNLFFDVSDSGIGIAEDKVASVFESFKQADASTSRKYGGTGLGLAISKKLVMLMGGTIGCQSNVNSGSIFSVTIPLKEPSIETVHDLKLPSELRNQSCFFISHQMTDDIDLSIQLLRNLGLNPKVLKKTSEILPLIDEREADRLPALIFFNCLSNDLTDVCGHEEAIDPRVLGLGCCIMFTRCNKVPFCANRIAEKTNVIIMKKPILIHTLMNQIVSYLGKSDINIGNVSAEQLIVNQSRIRLLLADDSPDNRLVIEMYLKDAAVDVVSVSNGREAIEKVIEEDFDVILMDIQMPEIDGYEAVKAIRQWEISSNKKETIIIALTAHAIKQDIKRSFDVGFNEHLTKPLKKNELLETIVRLIAKNSNNVHSAKDDNCVVSEAIDCDENTVYPDRELLELSIGFVNNRHSDLELLKTLINEKKFNEIAEIGHRLKGDGGTYGFKKISQLGTILNIAGNAGDEKTCLETIKKLEIHLSALKVS